MDLFGANFGYDSYNPVNYYSLQPEDLNPALRLNYTKKVNDYYSEPPVSRFQSKRKPKPTCNCKHSILDNNTIYILLIILIVITVIQFLIIACSGTSVVTNIITQKESPPAAPVLVPAPAPAETATAEI